MNRFCLHVSVLDHGAIAAVNEFLVARKRPTLIRRTKVQIRTHVLIGECNVDELVEFLKAREWRDRDAVRLYQATEYPAMVEVFQELTPSGVEASLARIAA